MQKFYEKKVKELAVKPYNKECFDCGKKGVQGNVNLTHSTFICTRCAGLHRGLSHKVNSIAMVNFTKELYEGLEAGGNKRAKKYWLAKLPEDFKRPEQNEAKMVEFLRWVYVEQRFVRKEGDPKKTHTAKKKAKAPNRDSEPKSSSISDSGHSRSQSHSSQQIIPSQKTGDSQISQTSHSTHSAGGSQDEGDSDNEGEDTHKSGSSSTGGFDMLTDFTITEMDVKSSQNGHNSSKSSEPDIFGDSSPIMDTPPKSLSNSRTAVDALVEHLREVMKEFHLNPQQIKSITSEALTALAEGASKSRTIPDRRDEGEPEGGNPFDDEFDDEPTSTSTTTPQPTKPSIPSSSALTQKSSSSSSSLFPDLDDDSSPAIQLGGPTSSFGGTSGTSYGTNGTSYGGTSGASYGGTYRPPSHPQTSPVYPAYGQPSYGQSPTSSMPGVLPGMNSSGYHQPTGSYQQPTGSYQQQQQPTGSYQQPTGSYQQGYPQGLSYNMSISMGGFSPYPQQHPHPSAFPQQPQAQPQVPEKPKGPDLFAGLDPFARS